MRFEWAYVFQPTDDRPGGLREAVRSVSGRAFDNMEAYADNAAIQAVWSSTAGTVTLETTSPMRGGKSLKLVTGAASDDLYRSIDFATFGFPFPSNGDRPAYKFVTLKIMHGGTGNETVRFKLYDASDASNNYAYVDLTVGTSKYRDFLICLDNDNTESFPNVTKGASWDPSLIDTIAFENLSDATTFYIDDIVFYYEHSLTDMIGFGSEAAVGIGEVGSVQAKLNGLIDDVKGLEFQTMQYIKQGVGGCGYDQPCTWALELLSDFAPPTTVEIEPGNYTVDRIDKAGATTSLVGSSAASESAGSIYCSYTPTPAAVDTGDLLKVTLSGGYVRADGTPSEALTAQAASGQDLVTVADSSEWTVGNLVHLSDGAGTDEWHSIASIVDPTTIQLDANLTNTFNIADTICEAVRTDLSTAVFFTRITTEADEQEVIPLVSKCENPRIDMNAGTGIEIFRVSLTNIRDVEPTAAEITGYSVETYRFREGTDSDWNATGISDVTMSDADGVVIGTYDFPNAEWLPGDLCKVVVSDITVTDATTLHAQQLPDVAIFFEVGGPPNADSTRNYTAKDVIGNKDDAIPAMDAAPGSWSLEALAKAILERVGATPADPDDSLHTIAGQRDDAAPAMDTAPTSTDTLVEHLKAIRETVGQTPNDPDDSLLDVSGQRDDASDLTAATATIVNLLRGLQGALGATPAGTGTGLEDDGSPSLVTALGTDGVNVTDIATSVLGAIGANNANNAMDSSSIVSNNDGSVLERLEGILSILGTPGTTDGVGSVTTAVDSSRTEADDYWNGAVFVCLDGANAGLARPICDFDDGTDTLTFEPGFPNAVASGVSYIILNLFDVARIIGDNNANNAYDSSSVVRNEDGSVIERLEDLREDIAGTNGIAAFPSAADPGNGVSIAEVIRAILTSLVGSDDYDGYTAIGNVANASVDDALQGLAKVLAVDGTNQFSPPIQGSPRTDLESALFELATYFSSGGGAMSLQVNNGSVRTNLEQAIEDFLAVIGCDGANQFDPAMFGGNQTTLEAAIAALGTALGVEFDGTPNLYDTIVTGLDSSGQSGNVDGSTIERLEALQAALQIVAAAGTGFEADGTGTTLYKALVGDGSAESWANGSTAQRSLLDMPHIKAEWQGCPTPNVDCPSMPAAVLSVHNLRPDSDIVQSGEITSAVITISRYRRGVDTGWNDIVSSQAMTITNGYAYYNYTFPSTSWEQGDLICYKLISATITVAGQAFQVPPMFADAEMRRYPDSMPTRNILAFDAFESYINDAAIQAVWNDDTGNSTITLETGSPLYGTRSMKVAVGAGGDGEAYKTLDVNLFGYVYELGQISAIVFQAKASTGTPTIQVTLEDNSDASNNYKYWNVQLSTTSAYYTVDLRSTADGTGGSWNPALIDQINFASLDANTDFHFDNVVLIYEQPLLDWLNGKLNRGWDSSHITANEDGSIPERLEQLQEVVNRGTGTSIAANKSLVDAIGHDGSSDLDTGLMGQLQDYIETGADSSGVSSNADGSVMERLEDLKDRLQVSTQISTHDVTTANDTSETDISTGSATRTDQYAYSIYFDLNALETAAEGGTITLKAYNKIDSTNWRMVDMVEYIVGAGDVNPSFEFNMISHSLKFTIQCSSDVTATRTVNFRAVTKDLY